MALKIKWNDDRIKGAATAVLLITRERLAQGHWGGLVTAALEEYRHDHDGYKANHPKRDLAAAKDASMLTDAGRRAHYEKLVAAVEVLLARLERNKTQFSSLKELDNYLALTLKVFD
ncbi:hypothetical protein IMCC26134_10905 [Verrucomicrobia bacterium IMCC26134]|jgi:hypothetical protein|nr:hypothetical protein IMCC26134_10905 [Verrucomicrobia bacterium IMCC26134]